MAEQNADIAKGIAALVERIDGQAKQNELPKPFLKRLLGG